MRIGDWSSDVCSSDLAVETGEAGLAAPLRLAEIPERLDGAIAVVRLPFRRWSSLVDRAVREPLADALARGANGVILITTGPTGEALLLNRSEEHTSELQSLMRISYAVFCLKKKHKIIQTI